MKTSKVVRINEIKPWGEGDRKTFYHNLEMENGDLINIGKKKELSIGEEITYEITGEGQNEYNKAKSVNPNFQQNSSNAPSPDNLKGIKIGHALNNSIQIIGFRQEEFSKENIKLWAELVLEVADELNA